MVPQTDQVVYYQYERRHPTPIAELESFLQAWLFFGLLHEILGDLYSYNDFVVLDQTNPKSRKLVSTSNLLTRVEAWVKERQRRTDGAPSYKHVCDCLWLTLTTLLGTSPNLNENLRLSIASVGELLAYAAHKAYAVDSMEKKCPFGWALGAKNDQRSHRMKANGWCPSDIYRINQEASSLQYIYFVSRMKKLNFVSHQSCSEWRCEAFQNQMTVYQGRHRTDGCTCSEYATDLEATIRILAKGRLPLLQISNHRNYESLSVNIIESRSDSRYVAISHVWADGLGNANANALPRCQLSHIQKIVADLNQKSGPVDHGLEVLVWMDTLCCPVVPAEAKNIALSLMKPTYEDARDVLVLDASLQKYDSRLISELELCVRIFTSGWMRRLWTLQEGALAHRLWIQFQDQAINLRSLYDLAISIYHSELGRKGIAQQVIGHYEYLRRNFHLDPDGLASFERSLKNRMVSVASDEPLLIGNLLGLDVTGLLEVKKDQRMEKMWSFMPAVPRGIPQNIVFRVGPRLTTPGYRWAPATLLDSVASSLGLEEHFVAEDEHVGTLSHAGLVVHLPGHLISRTEPLRGFPEMEPWNFSRGLPSDAMWLRGCDDTWYQINESPVASSSTTMSLRDLLEDGSGDHAVLLESNFIRSSGAFPATQGGLLVRCGDDHGDVKHVYSRRPVLVGIVTFPLVCLLRCAYQRAQDLRRDELTGRIAQLHHDGYDPSHPASQSSLNAVHARIRAIASDVDDANVLHAASFVGKPHFSALEGFIITMYMGNYGTLGPRFPSSQAWCVD